MPCVVTKTAVNYNPPAIRMMITDEAHIALNRFGLGARASEQGKITRPQKWLKDQVTRGPVRQTSLDKPPDADHVTGLYRMVRTSRMENNSETLEQARKGIRTVASEEIRAALTERITTDRPFAERLVAFWSNHLCISITGGKVILGGLAGAYEREAIRPHVFGKYEDMVMASAKHPAMLLYLDNAQSIGPDSRAGKHVRERGQRQEVGLNENYARELLELHTLGVDGGYTQKDVRELARILTGWGLGRTPGEDRTMTFRFTRIFHEPGNKMVLGKTYKDSGVQEGEAVIKDLVRHPSTARFIATKLATHFIDDTPPQEAVRTLAQVFMDTKGDLRQVSLALIDLEAAWDPAYKKFKTPQDWLISVVRTFDADEAPALAPNMLRQLRQPFWSPPSPKGYGDLTREWADPDSLMNRAELSRSIAKWIAPRLPAGVDVARLIGVPEGTPLATMLADRSISKQERVALAFAAPSFQWR